MTISTLLNKNRWHNNARQFKMITEDECGPCLITQVSKSTVLWLDCEFMKHEHVIGVGDSFSQGHCSSARHESNVTLFRCPAKADSRWQPPNARRSAEAFHSEQVGSTAKTSYVAKPNVLKHKSLAEKSVFVGSPTHPWRLLVLAKRWPESAKITLCVILGITHNSLNFFIVLMILVNGSLYRFNEK